MHGTPIRAAAHFLVTLAARAFDSPLRFGRFELQKRDQFVGRSERSLPQMRWNDSLNFSDVMRGLKHDHGRGMPRHVRRELLVRQRGATLTGRLRVLLNARHSFAPTVLRFAQIVKYSGGATFDTSIKPIPLQ